MMNIFSYIVTFLLIANFTPVIYAENDDTGTGVTPPLLVIQNISFKKENNTSEIVYIQLNRLSWPTITHNLEGNKPMLEIEWKEAEMPPANLSAIPVNGQWVKGIQSRYDAESHTLKIVMDLYPFKGYQVSQGFDSKDYTFFIKIEAENPSKENTKK
jgi:hypothetical protein